MMNDASVNKIIGIFTEAFEWNIPENPAPKTKTKKSAKTSEPKTKTTKKTPVKSETTPKKQTIKKTPSKPVPAPPVEKYVTDRTIYVPNRKIIYFTYTGEVNNKGQPHGKGKATYRSGNIYNGEWKESQRYGEGRLNYKNEDYYMGNWKNDVPCGKGMLKQTLITFDGIWSDFGKGKGSIYYFIDNRYYYGEWDNYKRCGQGKMSYQDGDTKYSFEGEWKDDKLNG
ncbi:MAG: hypothetical protein IKQ90_02775, partial [Ruminococcus sp.]|nr:hypothetical protein [Ruminococcus sp.]